MDELEPGMRDTAAVTDSDEEEDLHPAKMCAALTPEKRRWTCNCSSKCRRKKKAAKNRKKWLGWVK